MSLDSIDPFMQQKRCPNCKAIIHWGINTRYSQENKSEICDFCNNKLKDD